MLRIQSKLGWVTVKYTQWAAHQPVENQKGRPPAEGANPPGVVGVHPPLQFAPIPSVSQLSWGQSRESRGDFSSPACAHEAQRVSPLPRVVFVRPIGGRLEDLTHECLTTFGHSADAFVLSTDTVPSFAVPPVDPPHCFPSNIGRGRKNGYPPLWGPYWGTRGFYWASRQKPPCFCNGKEGSNRNPSGPRTLLKTQTRWEGKDSTPRSYQRTGPHPPRWATKPGPPIQSLVQTPPWGHGVRGWED